MSLLNTLEALNSAPAKAGAYYGKLLNPVKPVGGTLAKQYEAVQRAAEKWHVNPVILWGVYGVETSHGSNVTTSSAGAKGSFQFIAPTAKAYGYPYTNATDPATFAKQADAAAHYLAVLLPGGKGENQATPKGKGWEAAWDKALRAYSGGGYGLAEVVKHGAAASHVQAGAAENKAETATVEEANPEKGTGLVETILNFLRDAGIKAALVLVGVVLVIYGIMVAVKPATREQHFPSFSRLPLPLPA